VVDCTRQIPVKRRSRVIGLMINQGGINPSLAGDINAACARTITDYQPDIGAKVTAVGGCQQ